MVAQSVEGGAKLRRPSGFEVVYVEEAEGEVRVPLADASGMASERVPAVRTFPSYRGQRNYSGLYYAATVDRHA